MIAAINLELGRPGWRMQSLVSCCLVMLLVLFQSLGFAESGKKALSPKAIAVMSAKAAQAFKNENYAQAVQLYRELTVLHPMDALTWQALGQSLAHTNDVIGAQRVFEKVLEIQPTGRIADSTREIMTTLPRPDLFAMKIDSGLTVGDWMPLAQEQVKQGKRKAVLEKIKQYLDQFGPVPQLLEYRNKLQREVLNEITVEDAATAKTALPQIKELLSQTPINLDVLRLEARACHFLKDFKCAEAAYASWLSHSAKDNPERSDMVRALLQARQGQDLENFIAMPKIGLTLQGLAPAQSAVSELIKGTGAQVRDTEKEGPADKAGIQVGDVILKLDGKEVGYPGDMQRIAAGISPGSKVPAQLWRDNELREVRLTVGEIPAAEIAAKAEQATLAFKTNDFVRAAQLFRELVVISPRDVQGWHFLGQSLEKTGDRMGARGAFLRQLEIEPEGKLAENTRETLVKLPEPDLFSMIIHPGLTLGDWMKLATKRLEQGNHRNVLDEINAFLGQFGPVPQLLTLQARVQKEVQNDQEQRLRTAIDAIKVNDSESAAAALPQIRQLKGQAVRNLDLLQLEAKACHFVQDYSCAVSAYAAWLQTAPGTAPLRGRVVEALLLASRREELSALPRAPSATGELIRDCPNCPEMVVISKGIFEMGETGSRHTVTFSQPFAISRTEVTQGQWKALMGSNPSHYDRCGDTCPVENVSWNDARTYVQKLNAKTGKKYRLPSEAEWEAACRAGHDHEYCGSDDIDSVAWYGAYAAPVGNSGKTTHPVARKQPNAWGLYDMTGNASEWVEDTWHDSYKGAPANGSAWPGEGVKRVVRGGSWVSSQHNARTPYRDWAGAAERTYFTGFRVARTMRPSSSPTMSGNVK